MQTDYIYMYLRFSIIQYCIISTASTGVETEWAFISMDYTLRSARSKLIDKNVETICFLRSYF